jgi:hypothetical protein
MTANNWTIKDIRVGNAVQPSGEVPKDEPTAYHSPRLKRTIMGGPGNRSSIIDCSCGGRFDGVYEYVGHERRMCDWYARHASIAGGGDVVAKILRQYDEALDVRDYPDHPRTSGKILVDPKELLGMLRTESEKR